MQHQHGYEIALLTLCACAAAPALEQSGKTEVLWLGQACFKITTPGGKVIDPLHTGTPLKYIEALGNAPVKVFPINPGEKVEF